ncbi:unnamed protein product [Echinostoma caproni]|uniref:CLEC16A_C domain-containing protein n=1 Tax=Echinostoma caproni TaxID=27848 RepID=A0A183ASH2_9TREM|nr:unnamed protein product [Echinostoma caproni]
MAVKLNDAIFLDLFEHELRLMRCLPTSLKKLAMDPSLLIPPTTASVLLEKSPSTTSFSSSSSRSSSISNLAQNNHTQIERSKRLPQSQMEHTQHAIGVYLLLHIWLESLLRVRSGEVNRSSQFEPSKLPSDNAAPDIEHLFSSRLPVDLASVPGLAGLGDVPDPKITLVHKTGDKLDLSSEALIGCTVESKGSHEKRFLVNYSQQLVLVEPDSKQMGWGVITFIGPLQVNHSSTFPGFLSKCINDQNTLRHFIACMF